MLKNSKACLKILPFSALTNLYTSIADPMSDTVAQCGAVLVLLRVNARIVTKCSFDTPSHQLIEKLRWKTVIELIDIESKAIVFKSVN